MLGLRNSLAGFKGLSTSSIEAVEEALFELGGPGQATDSAVFHLNPGLNNTQVHESNNSSFIHLDPVTYDNTTTFPQVKTQVQNSSHSGYDDWEVVISDSDEFPNAQNGGYQPHDGSNPRVFNYMNAHLFERDPEVMPYGNWFINLIGDLSSAWDLNFMVIFQIGDISDNYCVLKKPLPYNASDPILSITRFNQIQNSSGWDLTVSTSTLGNLIHTTDSSGNKKNLVYLASARIHTADFIYKSTPIPQTYINVYDDNTSFTPNSITLGALAAYGDLLDPNRLVDSSVQRYDINQDYKDISDFNNAVPDGDSSAVSAGNLVANDNSSSIVSITSYNRQITVKVIFHSPIKPPSPWYDKDSGEIIYSKIKVRCFKEKNSLSAISFNLSLAKPVKQLEVAASSPDVIFTKQIAGEDVYFAVHTFKFDVSDVSVYVTPAEKTLLGIASDQDATVLDISRQPSAYENAGVKYYNAMIFTIDDISFKTNGRSWTRPIFGCKTFENIIVPTLNISNYNTVGADCSIFMFDDVSSNAVINRSFDTGLTPPSVSADEFKFEFQSSQLSAKTITTASNSALLKFDTRAGAINNNGQFVYIDENNQQTKFSGFVSLRIDENQYSSDPNISLDLKLLLNQEEIDLDVSPTYTTSGNYGVYTWDFDKYILVTGAPDLSVKEVVSLKAKVLNGSRPSGDYDITIDSNSTFSCVEDSTTQPTAPPQTDPADLTGQDIRIVQKYNKY